MTAYAESVGSDGGLLELDLFAGRLAGSIDPLPTTPSGLVIEEALLRFGPNQDLSVPTSFSNTQIADWLENNPNPPLSVTLIAAHRLETGEPNPRRTVDPIGNLALNAFGFAHKGRSRLYDVVAGRIHKKYGVSYNDNPNSNTGPEERSLAAWLLAESLVELCDDEWRVWEGCEPLADNITARLDNLYKQKIRIAIPTK